jgi:uncharacterized membrane protein YeiH
MFINEPGDAMTGVIIILVITLIGGTFLILDKSGVLKYMMSVIVKKFAHKKYALLAVMIFGCMLLSSFAGILEESVTLVPLAVAISISLGWDSFVGLGISLMSVTFGYAAATFNPFNVGITQSMAGLPMFSGVIFRIFVFAVIYAVVAIVTSIIVFLPFVRKHFEHNLTFDVVLLIADSLGLGIFSVVGVQIAYAKSAEYNVFLLLFVGIVTGVGGGVLRDVFALSTPHIFVKHFYACASIIGTLICVLLWGVVGEVFSMIIGALIIIVLRFLAAKYRWELPKPNGKSNKMQ